MSETKADALADWFRKIGVNLSNEDYEEGVRTLAAVRHRAWAEGYASGWYAAALGDPDAPNPYEVD